MSIRIKFLPYLVAVLIGVIGAIILSQLHFTLWWEPDLLTQPPPIVEAESETTAVEPLPPPQVPTNPQTE